MSASQSFLSSPDYGYDYVVAVTQDSINDAAQGKVRYIGCSNWQAWKIARGSF